MHFLLANKPLFVLRGLGVEKEREKDGASRQGRKVEQNWASWLNMGELLTCPCVSLCAPGGLFAFSATPRTSEEQERLLAAHPQQLGDILSTH